MGRWANARVRGNIDNPSWTIVAEKLTNVLPNTGSVRLETEDENDLSQLLDVRSENGAYLVTFGHAPFGDWEVLHYKNPEAVEMDEPAEIGDVKWNRKCICNDPHVVISLFAEYFESQAVPARLLISGELELRLFEYRLEVLQHP